MNDDDARIYDRLLVIRCQVGDGDAFGELVERYGPRLRYYLRKMLGAAADVEDALQEVWLDVFRGLPRLAHPTAFPAWLYCVARGRALRRLRRRPQPSQFIEVADVPDETNGDFSTDDAERVHTALDALAPEYREILVLRFLEEMPYEEIARVVGCRVGTVRSRLHYAKRALGASSNRRTTMSEKDLGQSLLKLDATGLSDVPDARQQTWAILDRDRRRVRFLTWLTLSVWLMAAGLIASVLLNFAYLFPHIAKLRMEIDRGAYTAAQRDYVMEGTLFAFQKLTLVIAFSVAVLGLAALCSVLLNLASRQATLRQINASLIEISAQLKGGRTGSA